MLIAKGQLNENNIENEKNEDNEDCNDNDNIDCNKISDMCVLIIINAIIILFGS